MSGVTRDDVRRLCELAALDVAAADLPRLVADLERILTHVSQLDAVQSEAAGATDPPAPDAPSAPRTDVVRAADPPVAVETLAPRTADGFVLVPPLGLGGAAAG